MPSSERTMLRTTCRFAGVCRRTVTTSSRSSTQPSTDESVSGTNRSAGSDAQLAPRARCGFLVDIYLHRGTHPGLPGRRSRFDSRARSDPYLGVSVMKSFASYSFVVVSVLGLV